MASYLSENQVGQEAKLVVRETKESLESPWNDVAEK